MSTVRPSKRARIDVPLKETSKKPTKQKLKANQKPIADPLPSTFKIIAGSYEKLLYGLQGSVSLTSSHTYTFHLKPIFIFPAHVSCIKAVSASPGGGKWLATGSADEIIKVWDLRRRKEIGGLMHHEGSITHLSFQSRSHLLSASEDGTLSLFHTRDWTVLRTLKGHKGRVNSVAVHPSGKVALSVGKDRTLRMWDLMRGKGSASVKLGKEGELVRWNTTGSLFAVQAQATIDIYSTKMALLHTITHPSRLHDIHFCKRPTPTSTNASSGGIDDDFLLAAAEDKKLSVYEIPVSSEDGSNDIKPTIIAEMVGHSNRVKAVETIRIALPSPPSPNSTDQAILSTTVVCTISSDGKIFVYDLASVLSSTESEEGKEGIVQIRPKAEYDTKGTRLTCVTLAEEEGSIGDGVDVGNDEGEEEITMKMKRDTEEEEEWAPMQESKDQEGDEED